jgi:ABC-type transport system substrate-binding protein
VRQALNYAIDKASLTHALFFDTATALDSPFTPGTFGYTKQSSSYAYDPAKATSLLASAGYTSAHPLHLVLWAPQGLYPQDTVLAQAIQQQLKKVNVDITIAIQQASNYFTLLKQQNNYDLFEWSFVPSTGDGYQTLQNNYLSNASSTPTYFNFMRYSDASTDAAIQQAAQVTDQTQRQSLLQEAQKDIWQNAPQIFLYDIGLVVGAQKGVTGVDVLPVGYLDLRNATK